MTLEGTVDVGQGGNTITNVTTAATGDQPDPSTAGDDLDESVLIDEVDVSSVGLAKLAGDAIPNGDNFDVTFTFVYVNNGNVDLANLSLTDDIAAQFGNAFVSASGLAVQNFNGSGTAPGACLLYTSPSPRDRTRSRMPSSA